ncbi:MAG: protein TolR [Pseudomonadota bacterium]
MGASLSGGRSSGRTRVRPMAEINVTPLVDVMLVLLIVFMVAAPLLTVGISVDLPETSAQPIQDTGEPLTVTITSEGTVFVQETETPIENLVARLEAIAVAGYDQKIYIRGDQQRSYGEVMKVMGLINSAGFRSIGLVSDPNLDLSLDSGTGADASGE